MSPSCWLRIILFSSRGPRCRSGRGSMTVMAPLSLPLLLLAVLLLPAVAHCWTPLGPSHNGGVRETLREPAAGVKPNILFLLVDVREANTRPQPASQPASQAACLPACLCRRCCFCLGAASATAAYAHAAAGPLPHGVPTASAAAPKRRTPACHRRHPRRLPRTAAPLRCAALTECPPAAFTRCRISAGPTPAGTTTIPRRSRHRPW